jgi:hypothetical protein
LAPRGSRPSATGKLAKTLPSRTNCSVRWLFCTTTRSAVGGAVGGGAWTQPPISANIAVANAGKMTEKSDRRIARRCVVEALLQPVALWLRNG